MADKQGESSAEFWHKNLHTIPKFTNAFIEKFASDHLPIKATLTRGYKFFHESYIHDVEVRLAMNDDEGVTIRAKCYRSMKKNEEPHNLLVVFKREREPCVDSFRCSCAAGQGLCHHIIGLMYTLAHYQMLGMKSVPPVISKTSRPQTWHIPNRADGVKPRPVMDVTVQKLKNPTQQSAQVKKKRKVSGVTSTVYKPFEEPLWSLDLPTILSPIFEGLNPKPGFLRVWPDDDEDVLLTESNYGLVPKGSVLSYQQSLPSKKTAAATNLSLPVPDFQLPVFTHPPTVLSEKQQLHYDSLTVTMEQALEYEEQTREQSASKDWHRLRKHRLTASNFKQICSRRKDHETLSARLLNSKVVQTAAMKYGIEHEEEAAQQYVQQFGRNVFPVGFVINPSLPHLGCSPDRRVYDATENHSWGLLEIKCSMSDYLSDLKYLKVNERSGTYSLRKTHAYYHQAMGCIGLTGSAWEDFFVYCRKEFHCERIYYDADYFSEMLEKLNMFYFNFHLSSVQ
ncbi:uncharacterized protein [Montipora capricornis]|uniref:uncharacterized protein n=1 Tax=Montipora capricornis TaxID=246305 RepID=UPI0035F12A28